jgi:hypothetical protein
MALALWLEMDQFRFVQLVMFGIPGMVLDAQVPSNPVAVGMDTGLPDEGAGEEDGALDSLDPDDALGAVGENALVSLFWKLHPPRSVVASNSVKIDPVFMTLSLQVCRRAHNFSGRVRGKPSINLRKTPVGPVQCRMLTSGHRGERRC